MTTKITKTQSIPNQSIVHQNPQNAEAFYYLGDCYLQLHDNAKAAAAYQDCIKLRPGHPLYDYAEKALSAIAPVANDSITSDKLGCKQH
jgi:tetratricopeptide (TPR) repeat protein